MRKGSGFFFVLCKGSRLSHLPPTITMENYSLSCIMRKFLSSVCTKSKIPFICIIRFYVNYFGFLNLSSCNVTNGEETRWTVWRFLLPSWGSHWSRLTIQQRDEEFFNGLICFNIYRNLFELKANNKITSNLSKNLLFVLETLNENKSFFNKQKNEKNSDQVLKGKKTSHGTLKLAILGESLLKATTILTVRDE